MGRQPCRVAMRLEWSSLHTDIMTWPQAQVMRAPWNCFSSCIWCHDVRPWDMS